MPKFNQPVTERTQLSDEDRLRAEEAKQAAQKKMREEAEQAALDLVNRAKSVREQTVTEQATESPQEESPLSYEVNDANTFDNLKIDKRKLDAIQTILDDLKIEIDQRAETEPRMKEDDSRLTRIARQVLSDFNDAKSVYSKQLNNPVVADGTPSPDQQFIATCATILKDKSALLQTHLGLWDCFVNALKSMIRTVCRIPESNSFFKPAQTPLMRLFSNAQEKMILDLKRAEDYDKPAQLSAN